MEEPTTTGDIAMKTYWILLLGYKGGFTQITRTIELPFAPFPGLIFQTSSMSKLEVEVEKVWWSEAEAKFIVLCKDVDLKCNEEEALDFAEKEGWVT
jgi:hypothetical protein